ncbi:xanthine dehydrogenase family protein molybdopterin-binding subunit [Coralloluteibacterium stylophorae]|uniref:Xanthine dehydrogenase family protein molybdopterin-binding subunit n=2 Tax=Coralloluteibacterium stylophorae TaxID=1776034 RepID=A0AAP2C7B3_9GAMM|nr:xanthine dehydrogenase family protein molybdopterin-binding subunit [Coralloluteibacterium stylophorae]MBS7455788.1 xanthine dehydrogenase family protein molybdopterin-binding subunit [Coralloluteibacterium stylophorae]
MNYIGKEMRRVDGIAKVTGRARYAAEFQVPDVAYGYIVTSTIARGRITAMDTAAAEAAPGVIKVLTHHNAVQPAATEREDAQPDLSFHALTGDRISFNMQPVAVVVAETFEQARHAARLVRVEYAAETPHTDVLALLDQAADPSPEESPPPRGNPAEALAAAPVRIEARYTHPIEHHNPMEPHGGIGYWQGNRLTVINKSQNVHQDRGLLAAYFGIPVENVNVISLFVGGAFGSSLRPNYYTFLLGMASKAVGRPVKIVYTRRQMFTGHGHRPFYRFDIALGADERGRLQAIDYRHVINSSTTEAYNETFFRNARTMYACPNVNDSFQVVETDLPTPQAMRAPGTVSQMFAIESAMDELAYALKMDPLELRLVNYAETDPETGKPFSSKALRECYALAAEKFGWKDRNPEPRSMRDGRLLVGWGMATGTWAAMQQEATASIVLKDDGTAVVGSATSDIGPGTYTTMTLIAADSLGMDASKVRFELGDTRLPRAPSQGGSWTTASVGSAVHGAAKALRKQLLELAQTDRDSPLRGLDVEAVEFAGGAVRPKGGGEGVDIAGLLRRHRMPQIETRHTSTPPAERENYATAAHGAQFIEVKVDPDSGMVAVTRVIEATACGRIMNPLTSHSQEMGAVVMGIGMALSEATEVDHRFGRMLNPTLADYHVPVNADIQHIETMFVEENDTIVNELGVKGMGELGMVGIPAAVANAVFHATGKRIRDLPITPDKLIG